MSHVRIEKWFYSEIADPEKTVIHFFLYCLSLCYRVAIYLRNTLFDLKLIPSYRSKKKVVSVGNITCGGTGKTSFTELLAKKVGRPVAILERGYRAKKKKREPFLVSSPDEGDEAFLLAKKIDFAKVIVGRKRIDSAQMGEKLNVDYILLDDGMQHRYLHRDLEIVVVHYQDLFGGDAFLPRGLLRESPKRLKKADYIVINGVRTENEFLDATKQLQNYTKAPLIGVAYEVLNRAELQNKKVGAFCGIGKPSEFYALLHSIGCRIVENETLSDHAYFDGIDSFQRKAMRNGAETIVCTEKDYVKLDGRKGVIPLSVELVVHFGHPHFQNLINQIKN